MVDICFSNQVVGALAYQNYQTSVGFVSTVYYEASGAGGAGACTNTTGSNALSRPNMTFTTNPATVTISSNTITISEATPVTPSVSISLSSGTNPACSGSIETFLAAVVNGGLSPSYHWLVNGSES